MTRIHAGHAYTHNKFALCIGKLEDDDPSSCLLIYDETFVGLWGFVDVPRILLSVTSFPSETRDKTIYVTMSDEGDVYFIEGDVPVEKIPGAGVRSDDAEDLGPMNRIICDDGLLFACGMGSQVYRRDRGGRWTRIGERGRDGLDNSYLNSVAAFQGGALLAVCGHSQVIHRIPTPEEQRRIDAAQAAGDEDLRHRLRAEAAAVEQPATGRFFINYGRGWERVELDTNVHMNDVAVDPGRLTWCVGDGGLVTAARDPAEPEDFSLPDSRDRIHSVRFHDGRRYLLTKTGVRVYGPANEFITDLGLPPGLATPNSVDVVDGAIWYFDYQGVARWKNDRWEIIAIPEDLWQRPT